MALKMNIIITAARKQTNKFHPSKDIFTILFWSEF